MILAPDRRILVPSRRLPAPPWRRPLVRQAPRRRHRPYCPLFNMADDLQIPAGEILLDADGNRLLVCCCSGGGGSTTYIQGRLCGSGELVNLWVPIAVISLPNFIRYNGDCYSFTSGNPTSTDPTGKTIISGGDGTPIASCSDASCKWIQAKKCADHTDADLWFPASFATSSFFFVINTAPTVVYYVDGTCNLSLTPGTPATNYSFSSGCSTCGQCTGALPKSFTVIFSGIASCGCRGDPGAPTPCDPGSPSSSGTSRQDADQNVSLTLDGSCLANRASPVSPYTGYSLANCTGTTFTGTPWTCQLNILAGQLQLGQIFFGTFTVPRDCRTPWSVSNLWTCASGALPCPVGGGGSALIVPNI